MKRGRRRAPARTTGGWPLLLVVALAACGQPTTSIGTCEVRRSDCQEALARATQGLRQELWDPWAQAPQVRLLGPQRYAALITSASQGLRRGADGGLWAPGLRAAGLLGEGDVSTADAGWLARSAAYYWSGNGTISINDVGQTLDDVAAATLMVHELVHAFQDRELQFDAFAPLNTEHEMLRTSLIEGEAELYEQLAALALDGRDPQAFDWLGFFAERLALDRLLTASATSSHSHVRLSFPYSLGGALLARAWRSDGVAGVKRTFHTPPSTMLELILAATGRPPVLLGRLDCPAPSGAIRRDLVATDTLGAPLLYAHLLGISGEEEASWEAALTWRADRAYLFRHPAGALTVWQVFAPGLAISSLGPLLAARSEPPVLRGELLLFWTGGGGAQAVEALLPGLPCRRGPDRR